MCDSIVEARDTDEGKASTKTNRCASISYARNATMMTFDEIDFGRVQINDTLLDCARVVFACGALTGVDTHAVLYPGCK